MYNLDESDDFDREMIATYEDVSKLYPRPGFYRPIVLIGAPGVGRNELKRRLVARDAEKYRSPIPCKLLAAKINANTSLLLANYIIYNFQILHDLCVPGKYRAESIYLYRVTKWKRI